MCGYTSVCGRGAALPVPYSTVAGINTVNKGNDHITVTSLSHLDSQPGWPARVASHRPATPAANLQRTPLLTSDRLSHH